MTENNKTAMSASRVGLCADCLYAQQIETLRGATFYLCKRSASDQRFQKYSNLPVVQCSSHQAKNLAQDVGNSIPAGSLSPYSCDPDLPGG